MYAHQVGGVAQMVRRGRDAGYYALLDECGLGKTIQAIYALRELRASGVVERAVVLCKCDLIRNWREEFSRHAPDWRVRSLQGLPPDARCYDERADVFLLNYELFGRRAQPDADGHATATVPNPFRGGAPLALNQDAVRLVRYLTQHKVALVCDESQRIKTSSARSTATLCALAPCARVRFILTGTLCAETILDAWSQIYFLDGGRLLGRSYRAFLAQYAIMREYSIGYGRSAEKIVGVRNADELRGKLRAVSMRRTKAECLDLPEKIIKTRWLIPIGGQRAMLADLRAQILGEVERADGELISINKPGTTLAAAIHALQRTAAMPVVVGNCAHSVKLDAVHEIADETDAKLVVWCAHRNTASAVYRALKLPAALVHGGLPMAEREHALERFRGDARALVCTIASLREGQNLQHAAHAVYFEPDWSRLSWVQSQDRIHRIGQMQTTIIERLVCAGGLDEYIFQTLDDKAALSGEVTGDGVVILQRAHLLRYLKSGGE